MEGIHSLGEKAVMTDTPRPLQRTQGTGHPTVGKRVGHTPDEQMKVLRHDHLSQDHKVITHPRLFHNAQKELTPPRAVEPTVPLITTARDEVEVSVMIEAL
jgi:hypothetical protein